MFYKEKEEPELREELFENPGAAYRGAPFWAWNKKLNKKEKFFIVLVLGVITIFSIVIKYYSMHL